ncbi:MAG: DUF4382 domain-containing protein [Candidatus Micrarchaeia archaeon]
MNKGGLAAGILLLIIIIVAVAILVQPHKAPVSTTTIPPASLGTLTFQLTDPPEVPNGTQALVISYASLSAHYIAKNGTSSWASAQGSGSVNLLSVVDVSQVIGKASIPLNATVDMVRFNITGATITISNVTYNVTVPSQQLTVHVANANRVNGTNSALIDLTPVVAAIYTSNSTIFVLVPSVRAIVIGSSKASSSARVGATVAINATEKHELELSRPSISVSSGSLSQIGNTTSLSVTVVNNANTSVSIKHIAVFGNYTVKISYQGVNANIENGEIHVHSDVQANIGKVEPSAGYGFGGNGSFDIGAGAGSANTVFGLGASGENLSSVMANLSARFGINTSAAKLVASALNKSEIEGISGFNFSTMHGFNMSISEYSDVMEHAHIPNATLARLFNMSSEQQARIGIGIAAMRFRVLNFFVAQNGTLVLPFAQASAMSEYEGEGYTIPAHTSHTFMFTGTIGFANGNMRIAVIPGDTYNVSVVGNDGARSSTSITAS